jgi:hypothetical protein
MKIGQLHAVVKTMPHRKAETKEGAKAKSACVAGKHCPEKGKIKKGQLHAIISWSNREGKRWYKRVHLGCLPGWIEYSYGSRLKQRGGNHGGVRPKGSGPLAKLSEDQRAQRHRLVREQARLLRVFDETWEPDKCRDLWARIKVIRNEIKDSGVAIQDRLQGHRNLKTRERILEKVERLGLSNV